MLNVQITKWRKNATADKSNVNSLLIPWRVRRRSESEHSPHLPGKHKLVNMRWLSPPRPGWGRGCQMLVPGCSVASFIAMFLWRENSPHLDLVLAISHTWILTIHWFFFWFFSSIFFSVCWNSKLMVQSWWLTLKWQRMQESPWKDWMRKKQEDKGTRKYFN